jgi:dTDP-L-rhamnose 4-epimerase
VRIVVSGGAGFVGSHIAAALVAEGHEVVVLDSLDPAVHAAPPEPVAGATARIGDVRDPEVWAEVLAGADAVCHQAARVGLGVDFADVRGYVDQNVAGTASMLWAMHEQRFAGRLVLASSMVVYGEGAYTCRRHGRVRPGPRSREDLARGRFDPPCPACGRALRWRPIAEDEPTSPRNVYAATKLQQEQLCAVYGREHDVAVTALRYHNVYGPWMPRDTPYGGVASRFRSRLEAGQAPLVFEDGRQVRDFVHVLDVARANVLALTNPEPHDGPLNIASGHPVTLLEMARTLTGAFGIGEPVVTGDFRLGDVRHIAASPARAREALGFEAAITPQEGLRRFVGDPLRPVAAGARVREGVG